jgi:hypothetical protein
MEDETLPSKTVEQLCEESSRETNTHKLLALTEEINRRLEEREKRTRSLGSLSRSPAQR